MKKRDINRAKRVDKSCRNNKGCFSCLSSRTHQAKKAKLNAITQEQELSIVENESYT